MAMIEPGYSIGIDEIDAQHARWIGIIEEFRSVGLKHLVDQAGFVAAERALEELLKYTRIHFASEEKFIAEHKYPELEVHKMKHRELEGHVVKLLNEVRTHKSNLTPLKLNLLATIWLFEHINQEDGKFARFITGKEILIPSA